MQERKKKQDRRKKKRRVVSMNQKKNRLQHKMMEIKKIQVTVLQHLQMVPPKMPNQTRKMQLLTKYLKLINFIKSSLLSLKLTSKTLKMSLSLWI